MMSSYGSNLVMTFDMLLPIQPSEQHTYGELANCMMGNKSIDKYVAHFKHLLQKAGLIAIFQKTLA